MNGLALICAVIMLWAAQAAAGSPLNLSFSAKTALPDGRRGEIWVHWDEAMFGNLYRAMIVADDGKLLAVTPLGGTLSVVCNDGSRPCRIVDLRGSRVLEMDARTFRAGPLASEQVSKGWLLYEAEAHGFVARPATWFDLLSGEFAFAKRHFVQGVAFVAPPTLAALWFSRKRNTRRRLFTKLLAAIVGLLLATASAICVLMVPVILLDWWIGNGSRASLFACMMILVGPAIVRLLMFGARRKGQATAVA